MSKDVIKYLQEKAEKMTDKVKKEVVITKLELLKNKKDVLK